MICPICGNQIEKLKSYLPKFFICGVCGGSFIEDTEISLYKEEYFEQNKAPSLLAKFATPILNFFYNLRIRKINKILKYVKNPKILDYGCGAGKSIEFLIKNDIKAIGFEPSEGARRIAFRKKLPVFNEIKNVADGYDLIMFWHSLEHVRNPFETIKNIKNYLNKTGKILIAIPNADSFEAYLGKGKWFHYTYPLHQIQFTPNSIKLMLQKSGFKIIKIDFFNPEYTMSGLVQTFLNFIFPKDTLYSVISHRRQTSPLSKAILISLASILMLVIFSPILILFFIFQLILGKTGAMVIIAEKL